VLFCFVLVICYSPPRIRGSVDTELDAWMRLYIDLSCFNRPFDDQSQERIRLETEAVLSVLTRVVEGKERLLWSWVTSFENSKHPRPDRRDEIAVWQTKAERTIDLSGGLQERAREFEQQGILALDAAHLAAEIGGAEVVLTCDDIMVRRARRLDLSLRVLNPVAYLQEVAGNG
jgi:hypothetical protein